MRYLKNIADKLTTKYHILELAFAVVLADSILDLQVIGDQIANINFKAKPNNDFTLPQTQK